MAAFAWQGRNPAARVYDSIGTDFFLALAPGWLNLGLWEGDGADPAEAPIAVRRLVERLAGDLPKGGAILDVGNGLGVQDAVIASVAEPSRLVALNITRSQLHAGRVAMAEASALPLNADAMRIPLRDATCDGVISVEAAFHFRSRERFFEEARRVLKPGGVLTMSDVPVPRMPRGPFELVAGLTQVRVWGMRTSAAYSPARIADAVRVAGFRDVRTELVGERVIAPALNFARAKLERSGDDVPASFRLACRVMLAQVELLWRNGLLDYLLLRAVND
jgi:ubiquinone/menaquinone biosynthesis C-methylase UbiE